jgi:hypothetical protein
MAQHLKISWPLRIAGAVAVAVAAIGLALSNANAETRQYGGVWVGHHGGYGTYGRKVTREQGYRSSATRITGHSGRSVASRRTATWDRDAGTYAATRETRFRDGSTVGVQRSAMKVDDGVYHIESRREGRNGEIHDWSGTFTRDDGGY